MDLEEARQSQQHRCDYMIRVEIDLFQILLRWSQNLSGKYEKNIRILEFFEHV